MAAGLRLVDGPVLMDVKDANQKEHGEQPQQIVTVAVDQRNLQALFHQLLPGLGAARGRNHRVELHVLTQNVAQPLAIDTDFGEYQQGALHRDVKLRRMTCLISIESHHRTLRVWMR